MSGLWGGGSLNVCVCVCVCVRKREREYFNEKNVQSVVTVVAVCSLLFVFLCQLTNT